MKKNGYTLIELLAVILVMGIISTIAVITINNHVAESRKGEFMDSVYNIFDAVEYHHTDTSETEGNITDLDLKNKSRISGTWKVIDVDIYLCNVEDKIFKISNVDEEGCLNSNDKEKIEVIKK